MNEPNRINEVIQNNHFFLQSTQDVARISNPLIYNSKIEFFSFGRAYEDGSVIILSNSADIITTRLNAPSGHSSLYYKEGLHLWNEFIPKEEFGELKNIGVSIGASIIKERESYFDMFGFASSDARAGLNYFLNEQNALNKFAYYFIEKAENIINSAYNHRFKQEISYKPAREPNISLYSINELVEQDISTIYLNDNQSVRLTEREKTCLEKFIKGKNTVAIGRDLGISEKTVRTYLMRIRNKLNCSNNEELISILWHNQIISSSYFL